MKQWLSDTGHQLRMSLEIRETNKASLPLPREQDTQNCVVSLSSGVGARRMGRLKGLEFVGQRTREVRVTQGVLEIYKGPPPVCSWVPIRVCIDENAQGQEKNHPKGSWRTIASTTRTSKSLCSRVEKPGNLLHQAEYSYSVASLVEKLPNEICLDPTNKTWRKPQKDPIFLKEINVIP